MGYNVENVLYMLTCDPSNERL